MTDALADTICSVVKNEQPYLMEWLSYHLVLGIKNFIIYDNESNDGTSDLLLRLERKGYIRYIAWPTPENGSPQYSALTHFLASNQATCSFVAILDADEFLSVPNKFANLGDYFENYGLYDPAISAIAMNQRVFGSSGCTSFGPEYVIERFTKAAEEHYVENLWFKSFFRPSRVIDIFSAHCVRPSEGRYVDAVGRELHTPEISCGKTQFVSDGLRVNHYILKSLEEFRIKQKRGGAAGSTSKLRAERYDDGFFFGRDTMINKVVYSYPISLLSATRAVEKKILADIA